MQKKNPGGNGVRILYASQTSVFILYALGCLQHDVFQAV